MGTYSDSDLAAIQAGWSNRRLDTANTCVRVYRVDGTHEDMQMSCWEGILSTKKPLPELWVKAITSKRVLWERKS